MEDETHKLRRSSLIIVIGDEILLSLYLVLELLRLFVIRCADEIEGWENEWRSFGEAKVAKCRALGLLELVYNT